MSVAALCCRLKILAQFRSVKCYQNTLVFTATIKKPTKTGQSGKTLPTRKKILYETEKDAEVLCNYLCGGNIYQSGSDPKLLPPEEYPDWLWELRTERGAVNIEDLEKDSDEYWKRMKKISMKEANKRRKISHINKTKKVR